MYETDISSLGFGSFKLCGVRGGTVSSTGASEAWLGGWRFDSKGVPIKAILRSFACAGLRASRLMRARAVPCFWFRKAEGKGTSDRFTISDCKVVVFVKQAGDLCNYFSFKKSNQRSTVDAVDVRLVQAV